MEIECVSRLSKLRVDTKGKKINLNKICTILNKQNINAYFDEMFPHCLFIKMPHGTYLIFASGKGSIRGTYSDDDISEFVLFLEGRIAKECLI